MRTAITYRASRVRRLGVDADMRDVRVVHELDGILAQVHPDQLGNSGQALWKIWLDHAVQPAWMPEF